MSSSTVLGGVSGECAWWSAEAVVEADCGGERGEGLADAGAESVQGAGSIHDPTTVDQRGLKPNAGTTAIASSKDQPTEQPKTARQYTSTPSTRQLPGPAMSRPPCVRTSQHSV